MGGKEAYKEERPWGKYERFTLNEPSTVKLISVNPGEALSLQRHQNRDEWWRILSGNGVVTIGEERFDAKVGGEYFAERGVNHRAEAGENALVFLEISFGEFDEEDEIKIEDKYGRT